MHTYKQNAFPCTSLWCCKDQLYFHDIYKPVLLSVLLQCVRPLRDTCLLGSNAMLRCVLCLALLGMFWLTY